MSSTDIQVTRLSHIAEPVMSPIVFLHVHQILSKLAHSLKRIKQAKKSVMAATWFLCLSNSGTVMQCYKAVISKF